MIFVSVFADSEGTLSSPKGSQLVHMTLMMHSWVVPSQMFAHKLLTLYPQLSHSRMLWSLWAIACGHMTTFSLICSGNRHGIVSPSVCRSRFSTYTDDECGSVSLTTVSLIRTVPQRRGT